MKAFYAWDDLPPGHFNRQEQPFYTHRAVSPKTGRMWALCRDGQLGDEWRYEPLVAPLYYYQSSQGPIWPAGLTH